MGWSDSYYYDDDYYYYYLRTNATNWKTVDIRAVHMDLQHVWPINIDPSICVPFCPTYVAAASRDLDAFMKSRLKSMQGRQTRR